MAFERNVCERFGGGVFSINQVPSTGATFAGSVSFLNNTAESGGGVTFFRSYLNVEEHVSFKGFEAPSLRRNVFLGFVVFCLTCMRRAQAIGRSGAGQSLS